MEKRLRMFAGPNGSGKSTLFQKVKTDKVEYKGDKFFLDFGIYVNADDIEKSIADDKKLELSKFGVGETTKDEFDLFFKGHSLFEKAKNAGVPLDLQFKDGSILTPTTNSYEASILGDFIRQRLVSDEKKLTFETVMSHESKVQFLEYTASKGYKNYLYFVSTADPALNKDRVAMRVAKGGHPVPEGKIESRYYNSLNLLYDAMQHTHRTFIYDNTDEFKVIAEIVDAKEVQIYNEIPDWVNKYLINKIYS